MTKTAAKVLVDTLALHGVDRMFCVPGESYISVFDALRDDPVFQVVTCRHEGGATFMAFADAKITGRPGVAFASRGPGATNAAIGLHAAQQDAVPMVLFLGQVPRPRIGRDALQEVDFRKTFSDIAKWVAEVYDPERIPEVTARAFRTAMSGTPGPVVVSICTDVLEEQATAQALAPRASPAVCAGADDIAAVAARLATAERPLLLAGGRARSERARRALKAASEAWGLPVMTTFENQDVFDNDHANFAGLLGLRPPAPITATAKSADLVLAVGTRLREPTIQGYTIPGPDQTLIHVYPDEGQIGINFTTEHGIVSDAAAFLEALAAHDAATATARADWIARAHGDYAETVEFQPRPASDGIDFGHMIKAMIPALPDDAIVISDAGSFASWLHRHFPMKASQIMLGAESGAMGFGVPAAVAAALRCPDRQVVALMGDGGMMMTGYELATAVKEKAKVRLIISNNANYGTIRFHQETHYPGRPFATELVNPDFAMLARSFGATGLSVTKPEDAAPALAEALAADGPAVIDVAASLQNVTAATTIEALRAR